MSLLLTSCCHVYWVCFLMSGSRRLISFSQPFYMQNITISVVEKNQQQQQHVNGWLSLYLNRHPDSIRAKGRCRWCSIGHVSCAGFLDMDGRHWNLQNATGNLRFDMKIDIILQLAYFMWHMYLDLLFDMTHRTCIALVLIPWPISVPPWEMRTDPSL